ncbi:FAD-dependent oxidoreductase [Actinopolymorpha sp. NPDC004070]|uniref:NAD(P)/FAD-dependent oxidoreductase n=1 Tax=Actinopolymorpha sp. NPDC004070 TaxID=3154548 RepID=UPI0033BE76E1
MAEQTGQQTYVVIGGGLAAAKAVEALRSEGFAGRVVLVARESELPYERPPLSKGVLLGTDDPVTVITHDQAWYDEQRVELRLGVAVRRLDPSAHEVVLSDGETLHYDKALLATGSVVRRLDVPGVDLAGVHYLRTLTDCLTLKETLAAADRVVVVGAGWIGLETAAAARHHGAEVVVVEPQPGPLYTVLGPQMSEVFARLHRDHGVEFRFGTSLAQIRGDGGKVTGAVTSDAEELAADAVIVGVGVAPDIELAEAAGLAVDKGVLTDERLRTSDPDVYAAGDVARWYSPTFGRPLHVEHWANAQDGGAAAGRAMAGSDAAYDAVPFFFSDQYDLGMEYSGDVGPDGYDDVVVRGDLDGREFVAFWLRKGRVVAGMNVNVWDVQDAIQALIRSGREVAPGRLADAGVDLDAVYA